MSTRNGTTEGARSSGNPKPGNPKQRVGQSFAALSHDAIELAELQLKLFKLDSQEAGRRTRTSAVLAMLGLALLLACLPVALFAGAEALVEHYDWSRTAALGTAAGAAFGLSVIIGCAGLWKLKQGLATWQRSAEELDRNVAWLKSALKGNSASTDAANPLADSMTRLK